MAFILVIAGSVLPGWVAGGTLLRASLALLLLNRVAGLEEGPRSAGTGSVACCTGRLPWP